MNDMWELVAHRGLVELYPENSLEAMLAAWEKGVSVELDVHCLADSTLICLHDDTLWRTTNAGESIRDVDVKNLSAKDLCELYLVDERWPNAKFEIPRLEQLFELMAQKRSRHAYLDIKWASLEKLTALIKLYKIERQCSITTPIPDECKEIKEHFPALTTQLWISQPDEYHSALHYESALSDPNIDTVLFILQTGPSLEEPFHCSKRFLMEAWESSKHKQARSALFYAQFSEANLLPFLEAGYKRLSTDYVSQCQKIVHSWKKSD